MSAERWTREQLKLAFYLYCQLPFGKLHQRNPEIIDLASFLGRTPSSVAMKLVNFASLDPAITSTGRKGLSGASNLDREIWAEFHANWEILALECEQIHQNSGIPSKPKDETDNEHATLIELEDFTGETRQVIAQQRIKQHFFRRAVLASYRGRCCISGISEPQFIIASHIVPWSKDKANRLNPSNGLCLSVLHDRAFDKGFITLDDDFKVLISKRLVDNQDDFVAKTLKPLAGYQIELPDRFFPDIAFLRRHREEVFLDNA